MPEPLERHALRHLIDQVDTAVQILNHPVRVAGQEVVEDFMPPVLHEPTNRCEEAPDLLRGLLRPVVVVPHRLVAIGDVVHHEETLLGHVGMVEERVLVEDFRQHVLTVLGEVIPSREEQLVAVLQGLSLSALKLALVELAGLGKGVVSVSNDVELVDDVQGLREEALGNRSVASPHVLHKHLDVHLVRGSVDHGGDGAEVSRRQKVQYLACFDVRADETVAAKDAVLIHTKDLRQVHLVVVEALLGVLVEHTDDVAVVDTEERCSIRERSLDGGHLHLALEALGDKPVLIKIRDILSQFGPARQALPHLAVDEELGRHGFEAPVSVLDLRESVAAVRASEAAYLVRKLCLRVGGHWNLVLRLAAMIDDRAWANRPQALETQPVRLEREFIRLASSWPSHVASTPVRSRRVSGRGGLRLLPEQNPSSPLPLQARSGSRSLPIASCAPSSRELHVHDSESSFTYFVYALLTSYHVRVISSITYTIGDAEMNARYAIRFELADSTLLDPTSCVASKAIAFQVARKLAKGPIGADVVRVWVDDKKTETGLKAFEVAA